MRTGCMAWRSRASPTANATARRRNRPPATPQLQQTEIWLVFFVEVVDDENRRIFEAPYQDAATGVQVYPVLVATGA
ncbi:MAG: hypothetical protein R2911_12635 [Caldilineaceae bacterium]